MSEKIILFGGSFDPVHKGHIEILSFVHEQIGATKSILIPAKQSPLKSNSPVADDSHRLNMLRLAIEGRRGFEVSDIEYSLPAPSYSYHTVCHFRKALGEDAKLYWLCGADNIADLPNWYKIDKMLALCEMLIVCRGGYPTPDISALSGRFDGKITDMLKRNMLQTPKIDISSTQIRSDLKNGILPTGALASSVEDYILRNKLYL